MARPFSQRITYDREAAKLLELCRLVESDDRRSDEWKLAIAKDLRTLAKALLNAPDANAETT